MSEQLFNNPNGSRGWFEINTQPAGVGKRLRMCDLYGIVADRLQYVVVPAVDTATQQQTLDKVADIDAICQNICCEVEKHLGIYPNVPTLQEVNEDVLQTGPKPGKPDGSTDAADAGSSGDVLLPGGVQQQH